MEDGIGGFFLGALAVFLIWIVNIEGCVKNTADKYIKSVRTEAVERGYGEWKTSADGAVWFEWKNK